jgi:hypothetical protein
MIISEYSGIEDYCDCGESNSNKGYSNGCNNRVNNHSSGNNNDNEDIFDKLDKGSQLQLLVFDTMLEIFKNVIRYFFI